VAALLFDLTADCLLLGLLGLGPFGGMVASGNALTRSRIAIPSPVNSLSRSSALIFDEAQTITANAALARSRGGNRSSAKAPTILCIVAFTVEIMPNSLSVAASHIIALAAYPVRPPTAIYGQVPGQKKTSLGRGGFALSVVILPPAISMPAQPLRLSRLLYIAVR
jgi:hypothetical protein